MKLFIMSIVTLAMIACLCTYGTVAGTKVIDDMINTLESSETGSDKVPPNAEQTSDSLLAKWEERSFMLSMFLPHHHLDNVKEKLVKLYAYANTDEFAEWKDATLVLKEELLHIRGLIGISADNIL